MEKKETTKTMIVVAVAASLSALSVFFLLRNRRKRSETRCYLLENESSKPQRRFRRVLVDNSYSPFKHLSLEESNGPGLDRRTHPYEAEVRALLEAPVSEVKRVAERVEVDMKEEYVWVESESELEAMVEVLKKEKVFGVDTEQHSFRSFLGFTALIQISTKEEDYLVDTIAVHDSMSLLRPVFADASICKVFHGADSDVLWLQRDFHIYVVNIFDTAKACEVLLKPQKSLAYLLETYCGVVTNKLFQREDWRQRPLSIEMVQYARTDAHYLLYIAGRLLAELEMMDNENSCPDDKFRFVLEASRRSNMLCLQLYTKDIEASPGESAASSIFSRHLNGQEGSLSASNEVQNVVRRFCAWRDLMARVHDESLRYILSDHAIVALAQKAPTSPADMLTTIAEADDNADSSFYSGLQSPSPVVCSHLDDFHYILQNKTGNPDDLLPMILQNSLGQKGSCPLSVFNYSLLVNYNMKVTQVSKQNGVRNSKQGGRMASRKLFVQKFSCKSPVYHNCRIYASDGRLLCYCDRRKLEWYLRRDLAKLVEENPPAIMLLFEPKGRPEDEGNDFYIQSKKNICVGCGEGNHYLRYRIIPSCYRMHFPEHLKSHRSHDIVLLCVDCHEVAHASAEKYKRKIAAEFGIPLFVRKVVDSQHAQSLLGDPMPVANAEDAGVSPLQLRTAAMALLRHGPTMPSKRREELTEIVMTFYGGRQISEEDLEKALLIGMTPHEKRRLQKKKGFSFQHSTESISSDAEEKNNVSISSSATPYAPKVYPVHESCTNEDCISTNQDEDVSTVKGADLGTDSLELRNDEEEASPGIEKNMDSEISRDGVYYDDKSTTDGSTDFRHTSKRKQRSKHSLLGHGPHGKQVVERLLKESGEDGVSQFCQRWRQVFVETVHPRFLPSGWDVTHSGRRDFGDFSVYNPTKKASAAI